MRDRPNVTIKLPPGYKGQVHVTCYYSHMMDFVTSRQDGIVLGSPYLALRNVITRYRLHPKSRRMYFVLEPYQ